MRKIFKLIISVTIPLLVGVISGFFTSSNIKSWYVSLQKPSWNPPNWVFAPVWTTLFILMGIAFYLVWKNKEAIGKKKQAVTFFIIQLTLNFFWSFIFFYNHQPGWALVEISFLWLAILVTIFSFARINKTAAWLMVPYISWVSFALILNYAIWHLNN